ncbi:ion transporter [Streptomyces zingiberis]|uniref:Ion transporter n=1 Tax=Streptomyces zingiberis TaxID=2053010 RepID=A0ABX1C0A0_9ACTN|nr:ion transporter [Streptomyces zingiberis]NJQ02813.1 ion transporter [Streptomyces zingiberis]
MIDDGTTRLPLRHALAAHCRAVTGTRRFAVGVFALILANALVLGVETYSGVVHRWHDELKLLEYGLLAAFTAEILLRAGACADRPREYFRDPWNLFDAAVVLCAYLPFVRENVVVLRLLRLARVLRAARFMPQLRVVLVAVARSLPGTVTFLMVGAVLLYVYAMAGWVLFAEEAPEHYGSIGRAVLTLCFLMILEDLGDIVREGLEISRWSVLYHGSFVLLASFVLVNVLIGVVISSLDEARELEGHEEQRGGERAGVPAGRAPGPEAPFAGEVHEQEVRLRIALARRALDDLEESLERRPLPGEPVPGDRAPSASGAPMP